MKKAVLLMVCMVMVAFTLFGCAEKASTEKTESGTTKVSAETGATSAEAYDFSQFQKPAEVYKLDLSKDTLSGNNITFTYDEKGRIDTCTYTANGKTFGCTYRYGDGEVEIYSFDTETGILVGDDVISLPQAFDADGGFSEIDGYYFKGFCE